MDGASLAANLLLCAVSIVVSLSAGWFAYSQLRRETPTVVVVDTSEELIRAMNERLDPGGHRATSAPSDQYPPELVREPLDEETAKTFYPAIDRSPNWIFDSQVYARRVGAMNTRRGFQEHTSRPNVRLRLPQPGWMRSSWGPATRSQTRGFGFWRNEASRSSTCEMPFVPRKPLCTGPRTTTSICWVTSSLANS
jgi:hypothetical protein